jgi:hypothetical protein
VQTPSRHSRLFIVLAVLAGIALVGWWWFSQGKADTPPAQRNVADAAATR